MIQDTTLFQVYGAMARYASESQRVSSTNIARASEPGYKAMQIETFQDYVARQPADLGGMGGGFASNFKTFQADLPAAPNGNTVVLEREILNSAEAMGQHNMALTVYNKSLDLLRTALGRF